MPKLEETEMLKLQLLAANITIATQARDAFGAQLLAKYGEPGETNLQFAADGTVMRAPKLTPVPEEATAT